MLVKLRRLDPRVKALLCLLVAFGLVTAYSLVNNRPIRFWPKWPKGKAIYAVMHPSGPKPDNIVLAPAGDMASGVAVAWRTSLDVQEGAVEYEAVDGSHAGTVRADSRALASPELKTDAAVFCHAAVLDGLRPGTEYRYRVGDGEHWSEYRSFRTAPDGDKPFSFIYFGDTQVEPEYFGRLLATAERLHPDTAFHMIGGDLVDRAEVRNLWDDFFRHTGGVYAGKVLAPAAGNHDYNAHGLDAPVFSSYFPLPVLGHKKDCRPANYSFRQGNAAFIVINVDDPAGQTAWLERELRLARNDGAVFLIVMSHYPVYNVKPGRSNPEAVTHWTPLFDQYGVDLVLTGHDHSYMRSAPLHDGRPAANGESGTVYVVANACPKASPFVPLAVARRQFTNSPTYQVVTIEPNDSGGWTLAYSARDVRGVELDAFVLDKDG